MGKFIDLTGQRFGKLVVIERAGTRNGRVMWRCACDCGTEKLIQADVLPRSKTCRVRGRHLRVDHAAWFWGRLYLDTTQNGCWLWVGGTSQFGYGVTTGTTQNQAHRLAWELTHGPIPEGLHVLHRCDEPRCARPSHLWLGTLRENTQDMISKGRAGWMTHPNRSRGERNGRAKLTYSKAAEIRRIGGQVKQQELARRFGVSQTTISLILRGKHWAETTEPGKEPHLKSTLTNE